MIIEGDAKKLAIIKARFRSFGLTFSNITNRASDTEGELPKVSGKKRGPKPKQK